jgi:carbamoyltransferase
MNILGISAFYHDSAACLVRDGEIVAAAQEERFSRKKHDERFPARAVEYCLKEGGITGDDLHLVAFYDKPLLKFDRLLETYAAMAPRGFRMFLRGLPVWLHHKLYTARELDHGLNAAYRGRYVYTEHHESHAASAFFPSPFDEAAIVTLDGVGEWATGSIGVGRGNRIAMLEELRFPHSLGLLYSAFTYFTGFKVNSGEYKLMGLAPYGDPVYKDLILERLLDLRDDGSFRMDLSYFGYCHDQVMTTSKFDRLFGGPPRASESTLTKREMDLAASIQAVTEEVMLRVVRHAAVLTGVSNLVLAGGVALNCVGNGRILREGPFDKVWIQPAAGDAGGALGAALFVWHQLLEKPRQANPGDSQQGSLLGPRCSSADIRRHLDGVGAVYDHYADEADLARVVAGLIADQRVVGHVAGRMEFGPRALGARSILGDARSADMQTTMNVKIKFRESFRPFAPVVLRERVHEFFEMKPGEESPYMLLVAPVRADKRVAPDGEREPAARGFERLKAPRSVIPAVTHVDHSARVQTVDAARAPRLYAILKAFERQTGCPVMINTSFNVRGEPIVCTAADAHRCFMATDMDALVLENFVLLKERQPGAATVDRERYLAEFALD